VCQLGVLCVLLVHACSPSARCAAMPLPCLSGAEVQSLKSDAQA
jgi:hypothetical protein